MRSSFDGGQQVVGTGQLPTSATIPPPPPSAAPGNALGVEAMLAVGPKLNPELLDAAFGVVGFAGVVALIVAVVRRKARNN